MSERLKRSDGAICICCNIKNKICLACFLIIVMGFYWQYSVKADKAMQLNLSSTYSYPVLRHQQERNLKDLKTLENIVQRRLFYLQNPKNCTAAKKVLCRTTKNGFGSVLHQLTFCLMFAFATQRTLILESKNWRYAKDGWETMFLPLSTNCTSTMNATVIIQKNLESTTHIKVIELQGMGSLSYRPNDLLSIPKDIDNNLRRVHRDPLLWLIGQFVIYLTRPNEDLENYLQDRKKNLGYVRPIAGLHIRRTDKLKSEAKYHSVDEYMKSVELWFNMHEKNSTSPRYIYLATDDLAVLDEAHKKYPNYIFFNEKTATKLASRDRYTEESLRGILFDVHMLSNCDFVTCTLSSNVCRLVFEIMHAHDGNASKRLKSLDEGYFLSPPKTFKKLFEQKSSVGLFSWVF